MARKVRKKATAFERFNNARAEKFELENQKTRRELIPRSEVEAEWLRLIGHIKYGFEGLPARMARELQGIDDPKEIYEKVERDVRKVFDSLADLGLILHAEASDMTDEEPEEDQPEGETPEEEEEPQKPKAKRKTKAKAEPKEESEDEEDEGSED